MGRYLVAGALALALLSGCDRSGAVNLGLAPSSGAASPASADEIRAELAAQNFGHAADMTASAVVAHPGSSELHFLQARVDGYLGKAPEAVAAFQQALLTGLADPAKALQDPAFDRIRDDPAFVKAEQKLDEGGSERPSASGDVQITETHGREVVRAGDVAIDTGN